MTAIKAWAANAGSTFGAFILQWLTSPAATDAVSSAATAGSNWVRMLIVSLATGVIAWLTTYFAPKNAPPKSP